MTRAGGGGIWALIVTAACGAAETPVVGVATGAAEPVRPGWVLRGTVLSAGPPPRVVAVGFASTDRLARRRARREVTLWVQTLLASVVQGGCNGRWPPAGAAGRTPDDLAFEQAVDTSVQEAVSATRVVARWAQVDGTVYARAELSLVDLLGRLERLPLHGPVLARRVRQQLTEYEASRP